MAIVLCISSQVARGYVGATAQAFALERMGHQVWLLPTILLSNHPGHAKVSGHVTPPEALAGMVQALDENGWLGDVAAVLTGYMPSSEHVAVAGGAVKRIRDVAPWSLHLCDPTLGDAPTGLYVEESAAMALKLDLLPQADIATPNQFELEWLTGQTVGSAGEAAVAAKELGPARILATSTPVGDPSVIGNLLVSGKERWLANVKRRDHAPHGTGDLIAALYLGHLLSEDDDRKALALACAGVEAALTASEGSDEMQLDQSQSAWAHPNPWPVDALDG